MFMFFIGVGKTSLVRNFLKKSFKSEHSSTIGLEFSSIKIKHNEKIFKIVIWDTVMRFYIGIDSNIFKGRTRKISFNSEKLFQKCFGSDFCL